MLHETVLAFEYSTPESARIVEQSVRPEVGDIDGDRTTATLDREAHVVRVTIEATDLIALRAGLNTWSALVGVAERSASGY